MKNKERRERLWTKSIVNNNHCNRQWYFEV